MPSNIALGFAPIESCVSVVARTVASGFAMPANATMLSRTTDVRSCRVARGRITGVCEIDAHGSPIKL